MFDISFWELALIFLVALMVLGPQQIPKVSFMVGRWLRYFRNTYYAISAEMKEEMQKEIVEKNDEPNEK